MRLGVLAAVFVAPLVVSAALADIAPTPDRGPPMGDAGGLTLHGPVGSGRIRPRQRPALLQD